MTIEEIREKILTDDEFVLAELGKVQYLYGLQRVIRSDLTRTEDIKTESVADHIYALGVLAEYFARIEDVPDIDLEKVRSMITWHDIDEIETGDVVGFHKTSEHYGAEEAALEKVIAASPHILQASIANTIKEYKEQQTLEARFVKALDKIEPIFYFLNPNGKRVFEVSPATKEQHCRIKEPYIKDFPYMSRFHYVTLPVFETRDYFLTAN